jgi:hypothetical protein
MFRKIKWVIWKSRQIFASRLSNFPFISGKNFADECDLRVTVDTINTKALNREVENSESIFVEGHLLFDFVENFKEKLGSKVIISGNSDANITHKPNFTNQPSAVLLQNSSIPTDTIYKTIPIGLENISHARSGFKFQHKEIKQFKIVDRVLLPPMSPTNQMRKSILEEAINLSFFDVQVGFRPTSQYFKLVRDYKFIFVCEGNGYDTHRLWEVLYQNSYPVILETSWANSLRWLNLPILFVPNLTVIDQELLSKHDAIFSQKKPIDYPQLWMPFWQELIKSKTKSGN